MEKSSNSNVLGKRNRKAKKTGVVEQVKSLSKLIYSKKASLEIAL